MSHYYSRTSVMVRSHCALFGAATRLKWSDCFYLRRGKTRRKCHQPFRSNYCYLHTIHETHYGVMSVHRFYAQRVWRVFFSDIRSNETQQLVKYSGSGWHSKADYCSKVLHTSNRDSLTGLGYSPRSILLLMKSPIRKRRPFFSRLLLWRRRI